MEGPHPRRPWAAQAPTLPLTAILTLALGIGVSPAIFSVANAVLLRPLPSAEADRLVLVWGAMRNRNVTDFPFPTGDHQDLRAVDAVPDMLAAMRIDFANDGPASRLNVFLRVIARPKPGVTAERAEEQAERLAAASCWLPARRAASLHPTNALRGD